MNYENLKKMFIVGAVLVSIQMVVCILIWTGLYNISEITSTVKMVIHGLWLFSLIAAILGYLLFNYMLWITEPLLDVSKLFLITCRALGLSLSIIAFSKGLDEITYIAKFCQ